MYIHKIIATTLLGMFISPYVAFAAEKRATIMGDSQVCLDQQRAFLELDYTEREKDKAEYEKYLNDEYLLIKKIKAYRDELSDANKLKKRHKDLIARWEKYDEQFKTARESLNTALTFLVKGMCDTRPATILSYLETYYRSRYERLKLHIEYYRWIKRNWRFIAFTLPEDIRDDYDYIWLDIPNLERKQKYYYEFLALLSAETPETLFSSQTTYPISIEDDL